MPVSMTNHLEELPEVKSGGATPLTATPLSSPGASLCSEAVAFGRTPFSHLLQDPIAPGNLAGPFEFGFPRILFSHDSPEASTVSESAFEEDEWERFSLASSDNEIELLELGGNHLVVSRLRRGDRRKFLEYTLKESAALCAKRLDDIRGAFSAMPPSVFQAFISRKRDEAHWT
jgi:hypothetical protein